jgi:hypothetical protein
VNIQMLVDGKRKLSEQETDISTFENLNGCLMVSFAKNANSATSKSNLAKFIKPAIGTTIPDLKLVDAPAGTTIGDIITDNPGKLIVFAGKIWVEGNDASVVGLRDA